MKPHRHLSPNVGRAQRGVTLIEALVALLVMSFGMVALVGLLSNLRQSGDLAKQRSEAMRLAQTELETLRSFSVLKKPAGAAESVKDYEQDLISPVDARTINGENTNTSFVMTRTVEPLISGVALAASEVEPQTIRGQAVKVTVSWKDRTDTAQSITLDSIISRTDPAYSLALSVTPPTSGVRTPAGRNPAVPAAAKDLGNGSSAFQPSSGSPTLWIINNVTGVVTGRCDMASGVTMSTLTLTDIDSCRNNTIGYLVSGTIRFSNSSTPRPEAPEGTARPLSIYVNLISSEYKEKVDGEEVYVGGRAYPRTPNHVCFTDAPGSASSAQTLVDYYCIVFPNTQSPPNWWGQVYVTGLDLGASASQFKVCRYSADYNNNGLTYVTTTELPYFKIDNEEHPETYRGVSYSLSRQNFLVVRGDVSCPTTAVTTGLFVDYRTYEMPLPPSRP